MPKTTRGGIEIDGLKEFRAALKSSEASLPKELTRALKLAGQPPVRRAADLAPRGPSGRLQAGYTVRTAGAAASIVNKVEYSGGAEWGRFGKWSGFNRYPGTEAAGTGRFAWRAVQEKEEEIERIMTDGLSSIIEVQGWARP